MKKEVSVLLVLAAATGLGFLLYKIREAEAATKPEVTRIEELSKKELEELQRQLDESYGWKVTPDTLLYNYKDWSVAYPGGTSKLVSDLGNAVGKVASWIGDVVGGLFTGKEKEEPRTVEEVVEETRKVSPGVWV